MDIEQIYDEQQKREIAKTILEALPDWFGIPESTQEYIDSSMKLPFFVVYDSIKPVGFVSIKENNQYTAELYVMGVLSDYHMRGIGRALVNETLKWARERGFEYLEVKTLDGSHPDIHYAGTRNFYLAMGFRPLECIPEVWGKENPCLIMVIQVMR